MAKKYTCLCGVYCKKPRLVSKTTYYAHLKLAPEMGLPQYEPVTPELAQVRDEILAEQQRAIEATDHLRNQQLAEAASVSTARKRARLDETLSCISEDLAQNMPITSTSTPPVPSSPTSSDSAVPDDREFIQGSSRDLDLDAPAPQAGEHSSHGDHGCLDEIQSQSQPPPLIPGHLDDNDPLPEDEDDPPLAHIADLRIAQQFISALKSAGLADGMPPEVVERLRSPPQEVLEIEDDSVRFSLELFLSLDHASEHVYNSFRQANARFPQNVPLLSLDQVKRKVQDISGIFPVYSDMCIDTCVAFTGPFADLTHCPQCGKPRYEPVDPHSRQKPRPRKQALTIPVGPQIQAAWRSPDSATAMRYRKESMAQILSSCGAAGITIPEYEDWIHGSEAINATQSGAIDDDSSVLLLSLDGAQLYRMKQSDCWIYIWVLLDRHPSTRYKKKHVLIGGVIPGPQKPKNIDSFLFPGLAHLSALMREGLPIWDATSGRLFLSTPFLAYVTADGPGLQFVNGLVGHSGRYGCRLYCPIQGRHKPGAGHYYPALLKPISYAVNGSSHGDVSLRALSISRPEEAVRQAAARYQTNLRIVQQSVTISQYEKRRLETGIARPTLISGLPSRSMFGIPQCFVSDIMHAGGSTLPDLMISLWRGTIKCDPSDDKSTWDWAVLRDANIWKTHGAQVAAVTPYLPGFFDRPPRNPAEKINSGYKAVEFIHYIFGVGPALLYGILPFRYWQNYCRLVRGWRLMNPPDHKLTPEHLREAHTQFVLFLEEFEELYYQRKSSRIHFVRQSLHGLAHLAPEVVRVGPPSIYSQWTMERVIGDLGSEIQQPSNPFANLSQRALRRCQVNAIKHMLPSLGGESEADRLPRGAFDLGQGYTLLRAMDDREREIRPCEADALRTYLLHQVINNFTSDWLAHPRLRKWARVLLPNSCRVRSAWKECSKPLSKVRITRMVKISRAPGRIEYAEVLYFFKLDLATGPRGFAMVSVYSDPKSDLLSCSHNTVASLHYRGDDGLVVIGIECITAALALPPQPVVTSERLAELGYPPSAPSIGDNCFYVYEKGDAGLDSFRDQLRTASQDENHE